MTFDAEWAILCSDLLSEAADLMEEAEHLLLADQGPSALELKSAPLIDPWVPGADYKVWHRLVGVVHDDPGWDPRDILTPEIKAINYD